MKVVIVGAGEVGYNLSYLLSETGAEVILVENDPDRGQKVDEEQDVRVLHGDGGSARVLKDAGVADCEVFLALTSDDKTNLIACSLAKGLGARFTVARIHDDTYSDTTLINYQIHFGIDHLVNPEAICAMELAKEIRNPGRVAVENFARGQIEVQQLRVAARAPVLGVPLKDLHLESRVRAGYIQRGDAVEVAGADTVFEEGDVVTLFGHPEALYPLRKRFDPGMSENAVSVVLLGGTETAIGMIRLLTNPRFKIRVIDKDRVRCQMLAERFSHVNVIHGDGTSLRLLEEEQVGEADYFIACTRDDEHNIMTCLQVAKLGAKHVQLVINKADYEDVLETMKATLNIETVVSPRQASAKYMMRMVSTEPFVELARLPGNAGRILEVRIPAQAKVVERKVRELSLPRGVLLVGLLHKFEAKVPAADDVILPGDRVVVLCHENLEKACIKNLLGG